MKKSLLLTCAAMTLALNAHAAGRPARRLVGKAISAAGGDRRPGVVLDLGAGAGADSLQFARRGWQRIHSEGGPTVLAAWMTAGRIAELHLSLSPVLAGQTRAGLLGEAIDPQRLELAQVLRDGSMLLTRYRVREAAQRP